MIKAHLPTSANESDVIRLHALARKQNYDEEKITINCYPVDRKNPAPLHLNGKRGKGDIPEAELNAARTVLPRGELGDYQGSSTTDSLMLHPEGRPATHWILLDHPITADVIIPMPLHADIVAVQHGATFTLVPPNAPHNDRFIILHLNAKGAVEFRAPETDGTEHTRSCVDFPIAASAGH